MNIKKFMFGIGLVGALIFSSIPFESDAKVSLKNIGTSTTAVNNLNNLNAYDGVYSGDFKPTTSVTNLEYTKMMYNLYNGKLKKVRTYKNTFTDVTTKTKDYNKIVWAYEMGIIDGVTVNKKLQFKGSNKLTRTQFAKSLAVPFKLPTTKKYTFSDVKTTDKSYNYISSLYSVGVFKTNGNKFYPTKEVTRNDVSVWLNNFNNLKGKYTVNNNLVQPNYIDSFTTGNSKVTWVVYNKTYKNLELVGKDSNNNITAQYSTTLNKKLNNVVIGTDTRTTTLKKLGVPISHIQKGDTRYLLFKTDNMDTFLIGNNYVTYFYDTHNKNKVRAIYSVNKAVEESKDKFYGINTSATQTSEERLMVYLMNESRAKAGLSALSHDTKNVAIAKNHSIDMAKNNYFSHTNKKGLSPAQRAKNGKLAYSYFGENIAYGHYDVIYAHQGLFNSLGHRQNILNKNYTTAIVGIAHTKTQQPYLTVNFYKK